MPHVKEFTKLLVDHKLKITGALMTGTPTKIKHMHISKID